VIRDAEVVNKTFPNFFVKLSDPPPGGLGAGLVKDGDRQFVRTET
jgi:hypothetical protein